MKNILIVEDELIIAKDLELKLKSLGYNCFLAKSYDEIIKIFEKVVPDLILMDILLKGEVNGIDAAKFIYEKYDIPVIYITANSESETIQKAKLENTYCYLIKPIKYEELKSSIELALYKYEVNKKILKLEEEKRMKEKIIMRQKIFSSLGELAAFLTHEIRQPLNTIKILADTLTYRASINENQDLPDNCKENIDILKRISKNVDNVNNIITNVNYLIKNIKHIKEEIIDINEIIEEFISLNKDNIKNNNIEINLNLDKNIPSINFSTIHFKEVLTNFLTNSIKAFKKTNKNEKIIIIETKQDEKSITINFIDNATGIKEEILGNIFDPFVTTDKTKEEGLGLGLYIVNNIINSYNGIIDCFNNEFGGATFRIVFEK